MKSEDHPYPPTPPPPPYPYFSDEKMARCGFSASLSLIRGRGLRLT